MSEFENPIHNTWHPCKNCIDNNPCLDCHAAFLGTEIIECCVCGVCFADPNWISGKNFYPMSGDDQTTIGTSNQSSN